MYKIFTANLKTEKLLTRYFELREDIRIKSDKLKEKPSEIFRSSSTSRQTERKMSLLA